MKTKIFFSAIFVINMMATLFISCSTSSKVTRKSNMIVLTESQATRLGDALWTKQLHSGDIDIVLTREHIERIDTIINEEYTNEIMRVDTLVLKAGTEGVSKYFSEGLDTLYVNFKSDSTVNFPFIVADVNRAFILAVSYDKKVFCQGYLWDITKGEGLNLLYNPLVVVPRTIIMDGAKVVSPSEN